MKDGGAEKGVRIQNNLKWLSTSCENKLQET